MVNPTTFVEISGFGLTFPHLEMLIRNGNERLSPMTESSSIPPPLANQPPPPVRAKTSGCLIAALVAGGITLFGILVAAVLLVVFVEKFANVVSQATETTPAKKPSEEHLSGPAFATDKIAVIDIKGVIMNAQTGGFGGGGIANAGSICEMLKAASKDSHVKAVILDMDTPGGEVTASDEIHHAVQELRDEGTPVITCMHSLGASGGYYVAAGTDYIIANRHTFTGSVGVIMSGYNYADLMGKVGLKATVYKSGAMKDMLSGSRAATPQEEEYANRLIRQTFLGFVRIVADGRKEFKGNEETVLKSEFADGRVVTGDDALRLKLVDQLGYFQDAVEKACSLAGVTSPKVIRLHRSMSLADILFSAKADLKLNVVAPFAGPAVTLNPGQAYYILPAYVP